MDEFTVIILFATVAIILLGTAAIVHITINAIQQRYRKAVADAALELVIQQPEHLARLLPLLPGALDRLPAPIPAEEPVEYAEFEEVEVVAIPTPELVALLEPVTGAIEVIPAAVHVETLATELEEALATVTSLQDVVRRKDRTRARYLKRLRRVDAVLADDGDTEAVFAALHPTLARAAAA